MRTAAGLLGAWLSMGCSFIFVRPPPSGHEKLAYFDCESGDAAPAVDVTNAVVDGLFAGVAAANPDNTEGEAGVAATLGIVGAVYAASAIYGFVVTSKCEGAKALLAERVRKTQAERDQLLEAQSRSPAQAAGCQRDVDCKGTRVCANAICVEPPSAATPVAAPSAPAAAPPAEPAPAAVAPPTSAFPVAPAPPAPAPTRP
jgi:hypothetical protein